MMAAVRRNVGKGSARGRGGSLFRGGKGRGNWCQKAAQTLTHSKWARVSLISERSTGSVVPAPRSVLPPVACRETEQPGVAQCHSSG
jgi:hypothetical protein